MTIADLGEYIVSGGRGHLVGIGGVSMSPLAEVLQGMGLKITGSDIADSPAVEHLRSLGVDVKTGHSIDNLGDTQFLIRTAAAHDDNPEIAAARNRGIPVFERAQAWGYIMRNYENAICIAGTHGKTTTTSMMTHILMSENMDPTVMIGGTLPKLQAGYRIGKGSTIVLESCEYYNSFHSFSPTVAVILNVEEDHLDFFKDLAEIKQSFRKFAERVPEGGIVIANCDDKNTMDALKGIERKVLTFGSCEEADVKSVNIIYSDGGSEFDVERDGKILTHVTLRVPGAHNVTDALAAITVALSLNLSVETVSDSLSEFTGAMRRFEHKGTFHGADIYDDYAHHPSELKALLDAVSTLGYKRVIVAFQPHTYTRTKKLFSQFVSELNRPDLVLLAEIYAAREVNTIGISSRDFAKQIPGSIYCRSFDDMENKLRETASPGDIILTVGAGDIYKVGEALVN